MFHTKGPIFGVLKKIQVTIVVIHGDIPRSVALVLGVNKLLAMVKDISDIRPIVIGKVFL
jgi:hypothetical protein